MRSVVDYDLELFSVLIKLSQNVYLLGTSLARPVIARGMIAIADKEGCECVFSHYN
jgi:argininosuccinate synthase